jgi:hypothetical protein
MAKTDETRRRREKRHGAATAAIAADARHLGAMPWRTSRGKERLPSGFELHHGWLARPSDLRADADPIEATTEHDANAIRLMRWELERLCAPPYAPAHDERFAIVDGAGRSMLRRVRRMFVAAFGYTPEDAPWVSLARGLIGTLDHWHRAHGDEQADYNEARLKELTQFAPHLGDGKAGQAAVNRLVNGTTLGRGGGRSGKRSILDAVTTEINLARRAKGLRPLKKATIDAWRKLA